MKYNHEEYMARNKKSCVGKVRLPTIEELLSLIDYTKHGPASSEAITSNSYWSSTSYARDTRGAWVADFCSGGVYNYVKDGSGYVRCVRETGNGLEWSKDAPTEMTWYEAMEYAESLNVQIILELYLWLYSLL